MTISTFIAIIVIAILLAISIRYLYKHGTCGSCPDAGSCSGHKGTCSSRQFKKDPNYKEKNQMIEEIMKKHGI